VTGAFYERGDPTGVATDSVERFWHPEPQLFNMSPTHGGEMLREDLKAARVRYEGKEGRVADFHALRHTFVTNLARSNVRPKTAQTLERRSRITLTTDRCTHVLAESQAGHGRRPLRFRRAARHGGCEERLRGWNHMWDRINRINPHTRGQKMTAGHILRTPQYDVTHGLATRCGNWASLCARPEYCFLNRRSQVRVLPGVPFFLIPWPGPLEPRGGARPAAHTSGGDGRRRVATRKFRASAPAAGQNVVAAPDAP